VTCSPKTGPAMTRGRTEATSARILYHPEVEDRGSKGNDDSVAIDAVRSREAESYDRERNEPSPRSNCRSPVLETGMKSNRERLCAAQPENRR